MAYRGHDLDLRIGRSSTSRGGTLPSEMGLGDPASRHPILVDDTLHATCNHAYEAAHFYGSREVRLDHLIYALTRVAGAAHVLDELGIRPERLRKEAALAIAAETPAAPADAKAEPITSEEFESVLRRTADRTQERGGLAGVVDLVRTILAAGRDNTAVALLTRASSDPQRLERWREEATRREPSITEVLRAAHAPDINPAIITRLDGLEAAMRALGTEATGERRSTHDLLRQVHDALQALGAAKAQAPAEFTDEIKGAIDSRLHDVSDMLLSLDERLHGIGKQNGEPLEDVRQRFERLEQKFAEQSADLSHALTPALTERVSQLVSERLGQTEASVSQLLKDTSGATVPADMSPRLAQLETAIRTHLQSAEEIAKTHERDLSEIYEALVKLGANQQTLANNLNTWRLDTSGDVSIVSNRLEALETTVLESLGRISAELQMLRGPGSGEEAQVTGGGGFKRWLYGTNRVLSSSWSNDRPGPIRQALSRVGVVKKS